MTKPESMRSGNIAIMAMEEQREANRIERHRLKLEKSRTTASIITVAIAAIAAIASSANLIISIVEKLSNN